MSILRAVRSDEKHCTSTTSIPVKFEPVQHRTSVSSFARCRGREGNAFRVERKTNHASGRFPDDARAIDVRRRRLLLLFINLNLPSPPIALETCVCDIRSTPNVLWAEELNVASDSSMAEVLRLSQAVSLLQESSPRPCACRRHASRHPRHADDGQDGSSEYTPRQYGGRQHGDRARGLLEPVQHHGPAPTTWRSTPHTETMSARQP